MNNSVFLMHLIQRILTLFKIDSDKDPWLIMKSYTGNIFDQHVMTNRFPRLHFSSLHYGCINKIKNSNFLLFLSYHNAYITKLYIHIVKHIFQNVGIEFNTF